MQTRIHHEKSDLILKIPKRYMITSAGVKQTERGVRLIQLMTSAGTIDPAHFDQMLVLYELLVDKLNPDSSLRPYYETIPTELPEIPCAWSEEDIAQLQAGIIIIAIQQYNTTTMTLLLLVFYYPFNVLQIYWIHLLLTLVS